MIHWKPEGRKKTRPSPENLEIWDIYSNEWKRSKNGRMEQSKAMEYESRKASSDVLYVWDSKCVVPVGQYAIWEFCWELLAIFSVLAHLNQGSLSYSAFRNADTVEHWAWLPRATIFYGSRKISVTIASLFFQFF
jgi:hypothetical protein